MNGWWYWCEIYMWVGRNEKKSAAAGRWSVVDIDQPNNQPTGRPVSGQNFDLESVNETPVKPISSQILTIMRCQKIVHKSCLFLSFFLSKLCFFSFQIISYNSLRLSINQSSSEWVGVCVCVCVCVAVWVWVSNLSKKLVFLSKQHVTTQRTRLFVFSLLGGFQLVSKVNLILFLGLIEREFIFTGRLEIRSKISALFFHLFQLSKPG